MNNVDTLQHILSFLKPKEAFNLQKTNHFYRDTILKNQCQVLATLNWFPETNNPGSRWEESKYVSTKKNALALMESYKKNPHIQRVWITNWYADLGWVANRPVWDIEWKRY